MQIGEHGNDRANGLVVFLLSHLEQVFNDRGTFVLLTVRLTKGDHRFQGSPTT